MDRTSQGWLRPMEISSEVVLPGHVFSAGLTASGHTWWLVISDAFVKTSLPETLIRDWTGTAWTAQRRRIGTWLQGWPEQGTTES
jgi:hypothetical protein